MIYALGSYQPQIHDSVWIAPGAQIIGNVILEEGVTVWFNAVLRGDNDEPLYIGPGCNIQDNSVLHSDPGFPLRLEKDVTVGHSAIVHGCHVEEGAMIGMGATVLNGARIGEYSILGAGSLLPESKTLPPRHLALGSPAKPVRPLNEAETQRLRATAHHYTLNGEKYRKELEKQPLRSS